MKDPRCHLLINYLEDLDSWHMDWFHASRTLWVNWMDILNRGRLKNHKFYVDVVFLSICNDLYIEWDAVRCKLIFFEG
jgi:hypothetical protein